MVNSKAVLLAMAAVLMSPTVHAQSYKRIEVVKVLPGWQCMSLASAYGPQGTNAHPVPVFEGPQPEAAQIGTGAGVIIAPAIIHPTNGRTEIIRPNGQRAWIDVNQLTPWRSLSDPNASCQPALLSNGRYGFKTTG
jgi:hypothetical protein